MNLAVSAERPWLEMNLGDQTLRYRQATSAEAYALRHGLLRWQDFVDFPDGHRPLSVDEATQIVDAILSLPEIRSITAPTHGAESQNAESQQGPEET